jgi:hypothetical protein
MHKTTDLANGNITPTDRLIVELVEPDLPELPAVVAINWPPKPTVCPQNDLDQLVATTMRLLANAVIELAALRVWKKL